jgi:uncharacterized membrane protein YhaH (DUF805 family)
MRGLLSYFSFKGRANRQRYWVTGITVGVFFFLSVLVIGVLTRIPVVGLIFGLFLIGAVVAAIGAIVANGARRLHDRNKSAWWLLLFQGLPFLLSAIGAIARVGGEEGGMAASEAVSVLSLPVSIWAFVELGCLKGTAGSNRFGEDPLAAPLDEVFA